MLRFRRRSRVRALLFPLVIGLALLWVGLWFALRGLGMPLPGIEQIWPFFPVFGGFLFLLGFVVNPRAYGVVFPGTLFLLSGLFFFLFSFGVFRWEQMAQLWPVFPLIGGSAFFALWLVSLGRHVGLLVPAFLGFAAGVVGLSFTATPLSTVVGVVGWPLALLAAGATLVMLAFTLLVVRSLRLLAGGLR